RIENYGTMSILEASGSAGPSGGPRSDGSAVVDNYGTIETGGGSLQAGDAIVDPTFNNYGSVGVNQSRLRFNGAFTDYPGSSVTGAAGTVIDFGGLTTLLPSSELLADTLEFTSRSSLNLPNGGAAPGSGYALIRAGAGVSLAGQFQPSLTN